MCRLPRTLLALVLACLGSCSAVHVRARFPATVAGRTCTVEFWFVPADPIGRRGWYSFFCDTVLFPIDGVAGVCRIVSRGDGVRSRGVPWELASVLFPFCTNWSDVDDDAYPWLFTGYLTVPLPITVETKDLVADLARSWQLSKRTEDDIRSRVVEARVVGLEL